MKGRVGIYRAQNIHRYATAKGVYTTVKCVYAAV